MKTKYYIVPFSHDGFLPWCYHKDVFDTEEEALAEIQRILKERPNERWQLTIVKAYSDHTP